MRRLKIFLRQNQIPQQTLADLEIYTFIVKSIHDFRQGQIPKW